MNRPASFARHRFSRGAGLRWVLALTVIGSLFPAVLPVKAEPVLPEYKVKALFLAKFAKYVEWPAQAFPTTNAPITIGVIGSDRLGADLEHVVQNKVVNGRGFIIKHIAADGDCSGCRIVFVGHSEAARAGTILDRTGTLPILTVGEDAAFKRQGGIITFVIKDEKVRLEINLARANKRGLKLSSKLLAVADEVTGRAD
jgi:hypothetical protein